MTPEKRPNLFILLPITLIAFAILCVLGLWQLQRLEWKQELITRIDQRIDQPAISLDQVSKIWAETGDVEYYAVQASGRFLVDRERHFYSVIDGVAGWQIFTPFVTNTKTLLVNRGFVPARFKQIEDRPEDRAYLQQDGEIIITGLIRVTGLQTMFVPDNDEAANIWYWRDLSRLSSSLGLSDSEILPFYLDLKSPTPPTGLPQPGTTRLDIPNKHLGYAVTWFALAVVLAIIVLLFIRKSHRKPDDIA